MSYTPDFSLPSKEKTTCMIEFEVVVSAMRRNIISYSFLVTIN